MQERVGFLLTEMSTAPGTLYVKVDGVWNSFMQYLYPLLEPLISIAEHRIELSSFADITAMKLEAIVQRGARKDFIDIYAIGTTTMPLSEMLNCYRRKYKTDKISHILVSLTYFNDADLEPMPDMVWDVTWKEIKRTIQEWVRDLVG